MFWLLAIYALGVFWYHKTLREGGGWDRGYTPNRRMMGQLALSWPVIVMCRFAIDLALVVVWVMTGIVGIFMMIGLVVVSVGLIVLEVWGPDDIEGPTVGPEDFANRSSLGNNAALRWCEEKRLSCVVLFKKEAMCWDGYNELLKIALLLEYSACIVALIITISMLETG